MLALILMQKLSNISDRDN